MKTLVRTCSVLVAGLLTTAQGGAAPAFTMTQTLSDGAQRSTLAFGGLAMMTGNLEAQSFFPPGKVADYTGFQYLRDNDPDGMGHNTSFLTRIAYNVLFILNDTQFAQLKTLAVAQQTSINQYGYQRFTLMKVFRRLMDGDLPSPTTGLDLAAVKQVSRDLYLLDGQISFDRALLYAGIINSLDAGQRAYLDAMKGLGWNSWPDITNDQVRSRMQGLPQGTAVAVMTYAGDLFSWYAGSLETDVYFCPERHGTYFGSFYMKDAPAIGHEGYSIDTELTATAGAALCDSSKGYVTADQAAMISSLVDLQRTNLYAGATSIVSLRTQIATLLRGLLVSTANSDGVKAQVLALSGTYGELDGENNHGYATIFARVHQSLSADQKTRLMDLRRSILSGVYADGTAFDFTVATAPYLYSAVITDLSVLTPYIANTDGLLVTPFGGTVVLGSPTATSIKASVLAPDQSGTVSLSYGTVSGSHSAQTEATPLQAGTPLVVTLAGLSPATRYYYRLNFQGPGVGGIHQGVECSFQTARPSGSSFTFTVQADAHLDDESDLDLYRRTLGNIAADQPDFHVDLGDTFMCEKHCIPLSSVIQPAPDRATVVSRYLFERNNFGPVTRSVPLFLVNGNHEGEAGWLNTGTTDNLAVWTTQARQKYFLNPTPDSFYGGDNVEEPVVGKRASWYAWQWGDALFVVLDPYWNSLRQAGTDPWNITLGARQYQWLKATLAASTATFKFVFIHNLTGGLDGQMRGGIEAAPYFEWGGKELDGTVTFDQKRPGWGQPIHRLLVTNGVTAVFHGHDHLYARQVLDGILYQEMAQPSARNWRSGPGLAVDYHYDSGVILSSSGHLRVTVEPHHVTTRYIRAWLPTNETVLRKNGQVDDLWTVAAPGWPIAAFAFSPEPPVVSQPVAFTDTSSGSPASWAWDFGDGALSALQNPSHVYAATGAYTVTLTARTAAGSHTIQRTLQVAPTVPLPVPAFTYAPAAPTVGQAVSFTDQSTGNPTGWSWNFGDGVKSNQPHPTHTYTAAGSYSVSLKVTNSTGSATARQTVTVTSPSGPPPFLGNVVLGSPTATSVQATLFSTNQGGSVYLEYGTTPGVYPTQSSVVSLSANTPVLVTLPGLSAHTRYYYRLRFQVAGGTGFSTGDEATFHTARAAGSTFSFCLQGDSHPERGNSQFDGDLYTRTLLTASADQPDFYLAMGDDFSVDQLDPATVTAAQVWERYTLQRPYLGLVGRSAPVFLVNGNHEQAARYLLDGTPNNVAVWAQNARNSLYSQPAPDGFYTGNPENVPYIGLLRNYFAWTWGDALFVVIDPYWSSSICVDSPFNGGPKRTNLWDVTLGDVQYQWLKATLEQSTARYKFVFAHHVMGTGRGGIELANLYEWGGWNPNGTWGFPAERPAWASPLHALFVATKVSVFFQGHDHLWATEELDGVVYQTLPEPADPNYVLYNADAFPTAVKFPNSGYVRVQVAPDQATVAYVRTYLPADEGPDAVNGSTACSYTVRPGLRPPVAAFTVSTLATLVGSPVQFTDTSANTPTSWLWNFGDGTTSTLQNPVHSYAAAGTYTATLTAANTAGSSQSTATLTVVIPTVVVTVQTAPAGRLFSVDGVSYTSSQSFTWEQGSSHALAVTSPQAGDAGVRHVFTAWSDAGAASHTVLAPASPVTYTATWVTEYQLTTAVSPADRGTVSPLSGSYYPAGTVVPLGATPAAGCHFAGWTGAVADPGNAATTIAMTAPQAVTATFANTPPSVAITSPLSGSSFLAPASIPVSASATDTDGTVTRVEFYSGSTLLGMVESAPYTLNWTGVGAGTYTLNARAYDNGGAVATSSSVTLTVTTPPLAITTTSLAGGTVGETYSQTLAASGGYPAYTWSISSGSLPKGLSLHASTGLINGTPTAAGTTTFTARVTDSKATTVTRSFSITVAAAKPDLVVTTVRGPSSVTRGNTKYSFSATVKNQGAGSASTTALGFYLSTSPTLGSAPGSTYFLGNANFSALAAGSQTSVSLSANIPNTVPPSTTGYYLVAYADSKGVVVESVETNNTLATASRIPVR